MNKNSLTYSHLDGCGNCKVPANYVVNNLVMCENRVHTHSLRAYFTKYILNTKELVKPFSAVLQLNQSIICFRNGAPPLRVAAQEALHHLITALPVGTHRALLVTPYFLYYQQ